VVVLLTNKERNMSKKTIKNGGPANAMSLRDYLAAAAMQGILACPDIVADGKTIARWSYRHADLMLSARSKRKEAAS
jgi:hypothetical protein